MPLTHPAFQSPRYAEAILASKPLRYYSRPPSSGTVWLDLCGTANMTIVGTPARINGATPPGIQGSAGMQFVRSGGSYATAGSGAIPASAYTIAAWTFMTSTTGDAGIFGRWAFPNGTLFYRPTGTANITFYHAGPANVDATGLALNRWYFVVGTWDGSDIRLYINGSQVGTTVAAPSAPGTPAVDWAISSTAAGSQPTGTVAECVVWSRALPLGEIAHFAALGFGR